jgi:uncharacterized protein
VLELSRDEACRIAVRAQLLDTPRPTDLLEVVRRLTFLQHDQTAAVAPSAHLVLWSRLGAGYSPAELEELLDARVLVELGGLIRPAEDIALHRAEMAAFESPWVTANDRFHKDVLERLCRDGPLAATEVDDTCVVPWKSGGWNDNRNVLMMLERLERAGQVAVARRRGRERLWDLAERVLPEDPAVPEEQALRIRQRLRLESLGIARARGVGDHGVPARVAGVRGLWRVDPGQLGQPFEGRVAILSPLDRLVYDRTRMQDLFGFDYQLEMYKPTAKRRWGYFALPVLHGAQLVGKVDCTADRKQRELRVDAVHQDVAFDRELEELVEAELADLAAWLRLPLCLH